MLLPASRRRRAKGVVPLYIDSPEAAPSQQPQEQEQRSQSRLCQSSKAAEILQQPSSPDSSAEGRPFDGTVTINVIKEASQLPEVSKLEEAIGALVHSVEYPGLEACLQAADDAPPPATGPMAASPVIDKKLPIKSTKANPNTNSGQFTSSFRGVTKHRVTGRYEAHFWDSKFQREPKYDEKGRQIGRSKGRQVYIGGFNNEEEAARAYDKGAIAYLGQHAYTNFPFSDYEDFASALGKSNRDPEDVIGELRRTSMGFTRGKTKFRGVAKHHYNGKWEARIGKIKGNHLYLGVFDSAEKAAVAYDKAAVKLKGKQCVTNYPLRNYSNILNNPDIYDVEEEAKKHGGGYGNGSEDYEGGQRQYNFGSARPKPAARNRKTKRKVKDISDNEDEDNLGLDMDLVYSSGKGEGEDDGAHGQAEAAEVAAGLDGRTGVEEFNGFKNLVQQQPRSGRSSQQRQRRSTVRGRYKTINTDFIDSGIIEDENTTAIRNPSRQGYNYNNNPDAAAVQRQQFNIQPNTQQQQQQQNPWWQQQLMQQPQQQQPSFPYQPSPYGQPSHPPQRPSSAPTHPDGAGQPFGGGSGAPQPPHGSMENPSASAWWQANTMINPEILMQWNALMQGQNVSHPMHSLTFLSQQQQLYQQQQQQQVSPLQQQPSLQQHYTGHGGAPSTYLPPQYVGSYQPQTMQMQQQHPMQQQRRASLDEEVERKQESQNEEGAEQNPRQNTPPRRNTKSAIANLNISIPPFTSPILPIQPGAGVNGGHGISPLAASLLSPLGLHADGKWKDSPLERIYTAQDESLVRLLNSMQHKDALAGIMANASAGGGPASPAGLAALKESTNNDDLWGTLQWLESLDTKQLAAGGPRRGPPQGGGGGGGGGDVVNNGSAGFQHPHNPKSVDRR